MIYFTATHGTFFRARILPGLVRSFRDHNPRHTLVVFVDDGVPADVANLRGCDVRVFSMRDALAPFDPAFYSTGYRTNVFKFSLFRQLMAEAPQDSVCWLDADMLVLDDLDRHLDPQKVCVVSHGGRTGKPVDCGNGVMVPGKRFVSGTMYSLPPGLFLDALFRLADERVRWPADDQGYWPGSGDQVLVNHLVHLFPEGMQYICDNRRYVFNHSLARGKRPSPGDPHLAEVEYTNGEFTWRGRRIATLPWVGDAIKGHLEDGFATFSGAARDRLLDYYAYPLTV